MRPLPAKTSFLCESLFDITTAATYLMHQQQIEVEDSRELFQTCLELARRFEAENPGIGEDYMNAIEEYAMEKLLERYGRSGT